LTGCAVGEQTEVWCPKCGKPFRTRYKIGHWEECPECRHAFYVSHDQEIRRMIEREQDQKRCRRFIDLREIGGGTCPQR